MSEDRSAAEAPQRTGSMSLRSTDVAAMMTRVEATLAAAEQSPEGAAGVLAVTPEGDTEVNVAALRRNADIRVEFPPGSGRPVVGPAVRLTKRAMRRAVSWYVTPMMEQQSSLNHALLDAMERLRLRIVRLQPVPPPPVGTTSLPLGPGTTAVAVGPAAAAVAALVTPGGTGVEVLTGDPVARVGELGEAGVDLLVADVTGLGPQALIDLLGGAFVALAPTATVIVSSGGSAGPGSAPSLHPRTLASALSASGFDEPLTHTLESVVAFPEGVPGGSDDDLAERLARLDAAVRAGVEVVVATRAR